VRIAVTGGTGYLGPHAVAGLRRAGHTVRLLLHPADAQCRGPHPTGQSMFELSHVQSPQSQTPISSRPPFLVVRSRCSTPSKTYGRTILRGVPMERISLD
jgi:hypothetical protein